MEGSKRVNFWGLSEIETPKGVIFMRNVKVDNLHICVFVIDLVLVVNLGGWNPHLVTYYTKKLKVLRRLNWIEENMYTLMNMCSLRNNSQRSYEIVSQNVSILGSQSNLKQYNPLLRSHQLSDWQSWQTFTPIGFYFNSCFLTLIQSLPSFLPIHL